MVADVRFGAGGHKMLDRIIGARFGKPKGLFVLPRTPPFAFGAEAEFGWTSPFTNLAGESILPGTPETQLGGRARNVFVRGSAEKPPPSSLARAQDERAFEDLDAICDWRGKESEEGAGNQLILHFQGPPTRYFPKIAGITTGDEGDQTFDLYRPFFYDRGGTVKVLGPEPDTEGVSDVVRGVAVRNFGTPTEEYVCIIGRIVQPNGLPTGQVNIFEVHAKSRVDITADWRFLGSAGPYPRLGTEGSVRDFLAINDLTWEMPLHFNRTGTRAIAALFGLNDAPDGEDARKLFQLEIFVDGETVTDNGLVKILAPTTNPIEIRNIDETVIVQEPATEDLPLCSGVNRGTVTRTETRTVDQAQTGTLTQEDVPVAFDYKIDTDDEIGDISVTSIDITIRETIGGGEEIVTFENACFAPPFTLSADPGNGGGSQILTGHLAADSTQLWSINGGRHSATNIGPIRTDFRANSDTTFVLTSISTTVDGNKSTVISADSSLATPESETTNMGTSAFAGMRMVEVEWADIRYGSLILNNKMIMKKGGFTFNSDADSGFPTAENPIGVPASTNAPFSFGPNDVLSLGLLTNDLAGFFAWGTHQSFKSRYFIESADFSKAEEDEEEAFAIAFVATSPAPILTPFLQVIPGYSVGLFFFLPEEFINVPLGTNIAEDVGEADAVPVYLGSISSKLPHQLILGINAGHDRHGSFFYALQREGQDGSRYIDGVFSSTGPNWNFTAYADYGFEDPVARVGMPPGGTNGELSNITAPLFDPVICV